MRREVRPEVVEGADLLGDGRDEHPRLGAVDDVEERRRERRVLGDGHDAGRVREAQPDGGRVGVDRDGAVVRGGERAQHGDAGRSAGAR